MTPLISASFILQNLIQYGTLSRRYVLRNEVIDLGLAFVISFMFVLGIYLIYPCFKFPDTDAAVRLDKSIRYDKIFVVVLSAAFAIAVVCAYFFDGHASDMSCWTSWGQRMYMLGTSGFYSDDFFCDYPLGYIYVLGCVYGIANKLGLSRDSLEFACKLPAIAADMLVFSALYKLGKRHGNAKSALAAALLYFLVPVFGFDSVIWGQIESVLVLLFLYSAVKLYDKKYTAAVIIYVFAVSIKPQALIAAPLYIFALLQTRSIKQILLSAISGAVLFIAIIMPFSPAWQSSSGFAAVIKAINPSWVIQKYFGTIASYPYFSINAFNLYGLLGLNWTSLSSCNALLVSGINAAVITIACFGAGIIFFKAKESGSKIMLCAYFLFAFIFTFSFKMHERYIILPIAFLLFEYVLSKNKRILYSLIGMGFAGYLNIFYVFKLTHDLSTLPGYPMTAFISATEIIAFIYSLWAICKTELSNSEDDKVPSCAARMLGRIKNRFGAIVLRFRCIKKIDCIIMIGITLVYSCFAFAALGDTETPQSFYKPSAAGESVVVEFYNNEKITAINYYCGIGDVDGKPGIKLSYSNDGKSITELSQNIGCLNSVFCRQTDKVDITARYLILTFQSTDYTLYEIGFIKEDGSTAKIKSVSGSGNCAAIADEQELIVDAPSYRNSTYFDEIYHPRTAYEHLHLMPYYETTHPPLGKLIMSVGIAIFGMNPFGWRCMGALMGGLMLPAFYILLKKLFGRTRYSAIGTLLFAFDFMHYSLTRMGTIDSYPVLFIICMYLFMYDFGKRALALARGAEESRTKMMRSLFLSGMFMGLGCASKWTAVYAAVGLGIEYLVLMCFVAVNARENKLFDFKPFLFKTCLWCIPFFVIIPAAIYILSYLPISMVDGYGNVFEAMLNNQKYMLDYHSKLGGTHPYASKWYTWPIVYKPMWAYMAPDSAVETGQIGAISIFQNPLLSWVGIAAFIYAICVGVKKRDKRVLFLLIGLSAQYVPWIFVPRYTLQYHFFATMPFLICFIIYAMQNLEGKMPRFKFVSNAFAVACIVLFAMFYPVLTGIPVSKEWTETMLVWFDTWVFYL